MVDQICRKITAGIPADIVSATYQTQQYAGQAASSASVAQQVLSQQRSENAQTILDVNGLVEQAQAAAESAESWVNAGAGITLGPEAPTVLRNGHVWFQESGKARTPLYPSPTLYPSQTLYPNRSGEESDGSHLIIGIKRWDVTVDGGQWTDFKLSQTLIES